MLQGHSEDVGFAYRSPGLHREQTDLPLAHLGDGVHPGQIGAFGLDPRGVAAKAVENLEAILSVEGVDAFFIGPYDLSASLDISGQFDHPKVIEALNEVGSVSKRLNAVAGYHVVPPEPFQVYEKVKQGYRFLAYSVDILFLGNSCRGGLKTIREDLGDIYE